MKQTPQRSKKSRNAKKSLIAKPSQNRTRTERLTPFCQGDLDSLCGLYSVMNSFRLMCPEIDVDQSHSLLRVLGETLTKNRVTVHETISGGIEIPTVRALVKAAQDYVRDILDISIRSERLKLHRTRQRFDEMWSILSDKLNNGHVAILGLSGRHDHWTVAYRVTRKTVRLFDSDFMRILLRSQCSIRSNKVPHQIDPEDIILLRRIRRRP